jgi:hypothetical protein
MNPVRMIFEDTPDCITIPEALRHRRTEIIVWPLDEPTTLHAGSEPTKAASAEKAPEPGDVITTPSAAPGLPDLSEFRATLPMQTISAGEFCRAMREQDRF